VLFSLVWANDAGLILLTDVLSLLAAHSKLQHVTTSFAGQPTPE
jgi:hypothetical protein